MLTSGTTGPPKRIDLSYETLAASWSARSTTSPIATRSCACAAGVAVVNSPLVHLGGLFRVLQCVDDGRSFALLERFTVDGWVDAVRRHRPATASLVPAALRMVLEADVDPRRPEQRPLGRLGYGAARRPTTPTHSSRKLRDSRAGIATPRPSSAAASRAGTWPTTASTGRPSAAASAARTPGCELRVVDPDDGRVLGAGAEGLLEVKAAQLGDGSSWIRTTDLARIDADGFLWILGRADRVIIRGGFKVPSRGRARGARAASRACAAPRW